MPIIVADQLGEIVLLGENADEDVGCRHRRKQQVSDRYRWRRQNAIMKPRQIGCRTELYLFKIEGTV